MGKAAHISIEGVELKDLFLFAETVPEIRGIGFYPAEGLLHIDTRQLDKDEPKDLWIKENGKIHPLSGEHRARHRLA